MGTDSEAYPVGEVLRKISPIPIELRRPIIRASGHTFEYLGFGPGNSQRISGETGQSSHREEIINSQARSSAGGIAVYTGMNDRGDFGGNKRIWFRWRRSRC